VPGLNGLAWVPTIESKPSKAFSGSLSNHSDKNSAADWVRQRRHYAQKGAKVCLFSK
jgi:hypothetical protein